MFFPSYIIDNQPDNSAVMNRLYQAEGLQGLERENFAAFDESIFPAPSTAPNWTSW